VASTFQVAALPDPLPEDCERLVAPGAGPAAAVVRPLNMSASKQPNVTIVACVKNLRAPTASAWLHVVPADAGYGPHLRSDNPVPLAPGSTAIVWADVPVGSHAAFIEVRGLLAAPHASFADPLHRATADTVRSKPCIFSRISETASMRPAPATGAGGGQVDDVESDDEWPLLRHLHRIQQQPPDAPHVRAPSGAARGPGATPRARAARSGKTAEEEWCGLADWEAVSMHEVVAAFLQAEWYKEEHREWRGMEPMQSAVLHPNTSDDNQNVLRAMLMSTPRKVVVSYCCILLLADRRLPICLPACLHPPMLRAVCAPLPFPAILAHTIAPPQCPECNEGVGADQHAAHATSQHSLVQGNSPQPSPPRILAPHVRKGRSPCRL